MVLALQHQVLPPTLHVAEPSPHVDWLAGQVRLLAEPVPWPGGGDRPRRAGVSAFGISGTNAHLILEEAPAPEPVPAVAREDGGVLAAGTGAYAWLVSGRTAGGLAGQARRLAAHVAGRPGLDPGDVGWSLAVGRSVLENRAVVTGTGSGELVPGLAAVAAGEPAPGVVTGIVAPGGAGKVVFVFPGQGGQWAGMGAELMHSSPVFAARLAECGRALAPHVGWDLLEVIGGRGPGLEWEDVLQPVLWAVMVSLAAVWQAAGVTPDAVAGHSQGEIAAACVAGVLSLEDAAEVVALRSRALGVLAGHGAMASVAEPAEQVRQRLAGRGGGLSVAAVNGPTATVVSGEPAAVAELVAQYAAQGVRARMLAVHYASHGPQVEAIREEIVVGLAGIRPGPGQVPMISAMTGQWLDGPDADAGYWYDSLRAPVQFGRAVRVLAGSGYRVFIEMSAHPVLTTAIAETLEDADGGPVVAGTLRRDDGGPSRLVTALAEAWVRGVGVDWAAVLGGGTVVELPTYAFQRQRYWPRPRPVAAGGGDGAGTVAEARFWAAVEGGDLQALADTLDAGSGQQPLGQVLPMLAAWRRRERDRSVIDGWRYRVSWVPVADPEPGLLSGTWLVVVPADGAAGDLAQGLVQAMAARGGPAVVVEVAAEIDRTALADRIAAALTGTCAIAGVVSLLGLVETPMPGYPVTAGLAGSLALVQALGDAGIGAPLWLLTRGAVAAGAGEVPASPSHAMVWGLGRVAGLEHPDRWGGLIDVPAVLDERAAARLCAVLAGCGEDQVAIRGSGIVARRLVRAQVPVASGRWVPRGTVLVTGGTGAIGPYTARWLADRGAERVVLASRSGSAVAGVAGLAAGVALAGTEVSVLACDVADRQAMAGALDWIGQEGPPLTAVLHAAMGLKLESVTETDIAGLAAGLSAKVAGADVLDELTADMNLDAFVLFSSIAGVWGSGNHGVYAAGNAYLDALAMNRRGRGLPATSVAWGVWDAGWDQEQDQVAKAAAVLRRQGLRLMDSGLALAALERVLGDAETSLAIADVDWARFAPVFQVARQWPLLDEIAEVQALAAAPAGQTAAEQGDEGLAGQLAGETPAERERLLLDLVRVHAAVVLGHASAEAVAPGRAFRDLGFDSVTAVELRNRLTQATGLRLPATLVFDYPTPTALGRHLREKLCPDENKLRKVLASDPASGRNEKVEAIKAADAALLVRMALDSKRTDS
jgi:acyl transferase domain-containing protein/acyl carrier protein